MSEQHDEGKPLSPDDQNFLRNVAELYSPPQMTASQRIRFDARLEERIRDRGAHRRPWFAVAAAVAATLSLLIWRTVIDASGGVEVAQVGVSEPTVIETGAIGDAWILAMTTDSPADSDDTLPPDYLAISDLLLGN
jgi:hypothetical protein